MRYIYLLNTSVHKYQNNLPMETVDFLPLEIFKPKLSLKRSYKKQTNKNCRKAGSKTVTKTISYLDIRPP